MKVGSLITTPDLTTKQMGIVKEIFESEEEEGRMLMRIHWLDFQVLPEVLPMDLGLVVEAK